MRFANSRKYPEVAKNRTPRETLDREIGAHTIVGDAMKVYQQASHAGRGAFGVVWKAFGPHREKVAIKSLPNGDIQEKKRNVQELRVVTRLRHANIVGHVQAYLHNNLIQLVMEFLEGGTLAEAMRGSLKTHARTRARIGMLANSL